MKFLDDLRAAIRGLSADKQDWVAPSAWLITWDAEGRDVCTVVVGAKPVAQRGQYVHALCRMEFAPLIVREIERQALIAAAMKFEDQLMGDERWNNHQVGATLRRLAQEG